MIHHGRYLTCEAFNIVPVSKAGAAIVDKFGDRVDGVGDRDQAGGHSLVARYALGVQPGRNEKYAILFVLRCYLLLAQEASLD